MDQADLPVHLLAGQAGRLGGARATASRISPLTAVITFGSSAALGGSAGAWSTCGTCRRPESTVAAAMAMDSRLIRTFPRPMVCAARFASSGAYGTDPEKAGTGSCDQSEPMPNSLTAWAHWPGVSRSDRATNAVLRPRQKRY